MAVPCGITQPWSCAEWVQAGGCGAVLLCGVFFLSFVPWKKAVLLPQCKRLIKRTVGRMVGGC